MGVRDARTRSKNSKTSSYERRMFVWIMVLNMRVATL